MPKIAANDVDLAKGISSIRALPDPTLGALWDSILVEPAL